MLVAILLGIIEGLTEFLPISSTGHLLIVQHWLGQRSDLFNIAIQCGAILAVTLVYRVRIVELLTAWRRDLAVRDHLLKIIAAFLVTCVLGLGAKLAGAELPDTVQPVAWALIIGGFAIFAIERWLRAQTVSERITWTVALAVGAAQVLAGVFPGTSRSAAAIFAALLAGLTHRARAAEFAFLVGIPTMFAATGFEVLKALRNGTSAAEPWSELLVALLVSAAVGFMAVKWLLKFISGHSYVPFAWYRLALGAVLLLLL
jgi:undecaprenyl-diphosphatase